MRWHENNLHPSKLMIISNQKFTGMQQDPENYINSLELQSLAVFDNYMQKGAVITEEGAEQSFISNKSIISFASSVSAKHRNDILDSTLLAQLAANKKFPDENDGILWYKHYTEVLSNIGWVVENAEFSTFETKENLVEVKDAIISILTAAFGGTFIGIITKTLDAVKGLGENGTIIAFKKNTQSLNKGCFQLALAVEENDTVSLQMGAFLLEAKNTITQVLFFKSSKDITRLTYNSQRATLHTNRYTAIRGTVSKKIGEEIDKNIAEIDI